MGIPSVAVVMTVAMLTMAWACIPTGVDSCCSGCQCLPAIPAVQCECGGRPPQCQSCTASQQPLWSYLPPSPSYAAVQEQSSLHVQENAPTVDESQYPTANNRFPHILPSPQIFGHQLDTTSLHLPLAHSDNISLEQAIQYYNHKNNESLKLPTKIDADFKGFPSVYYAEHAPTPTTSTTPSTTTTAGSVSGDKLNKTEPRAHASETFTVPSPLRVNDAYRVYQAQVCAGIVLGRSLEPDGRSVSQKCTAINCAAANLKLMPDGAYEVIYLKTVDVRRYARNYDCISANVPIYQSEEEKRTTDIIKQLAQRDQSRMNGVPLRPTRIRATTVEPKGGY